jgi:hypothetical protein
MLLNCFRSAEHPEDDRNTLNNSVSVVYSTRTITTSNFAGRHAVYGYCE